MPESGARLAILAQSGRMLAQSAVRAGWRPWVLDLHGDEDTRAGSERCVVVDDGRGGFDHSLVLDELRRAAAEGVAGVVYGSGLECAPDWLAEISTVLPLWGNSPEILHSLKSPSRFFALLDSLDIPYPESCFQAPCLVSGITTAVSTCSRAALAEPSSGNTVELSAVSKPSFRHGLPTGTAAKPKSMDRDVAGRRHAPSMAMDPGIPCRGDDVLIVLPSPGWKGGGTQRSEEMRRFPCCQGIGWLVKPGCGEGGKGVAFCAAASDVEEGGYFQRHIAGTPMSALFLADGSRACLVGFNELWTVGTAGQPFGFAGASNRPDLPPFWRGRLAEWVRLLAGRVGLKGLNSLDFVFDGCRCWVLEVNPRPSATLALYDADFPEGLLAAHVRACGGLLPENVHSAVPRAMRIVYAPRRLMVPAGVQWPSWCADLPAAGSEIAAGQPLCSVAVEGGEADLPRLSLERERMALALCRSL